MHSISRHYTTYTDDSLSLNFIKTKLSKKSFVHKLQSITVFGFNWSKRAGREYLLRIVFSILNWNGWFQTWFPMTNFTGISSRSLWDTGPVLPDTTSRYRPVRPTSTQKTVNYRLWPSTSNLITVCLDQWPFTLVVTVFSLLKYGWKFFSE